MFALKNVLRGNALSCIIFGLIFISSPQKTGIFLGGSNIIIPNIVLLILGIGLIINAAHLLWASFKVKPNKLLIIYFSVGDFIWTVGSIALIFFSPWVTTPQGIITTCLVAAIVAMFGILQLIRMKNDSVFDKSVF